MKIIKAVVSSILLYAFLINIGYAAPSKAETTTIKLTEYIYAINFSHYTSLVVIGREEVLITDPANNYRAGVLLGEIKKLTKKPVGKIVLSHEHFDHVGGTGVFSNAEIIAHRNILEYTDLDPLNILPESIDTTFETKMNINMGTTQIELHHMGAADGLAMLVVYLPREKVAYTADLYDDGGLVQGAFLTDTNLLGNRKILNALADWELKYTVNAHSVRTDLRSLIAMTHFLNDLYAAIMPKLQKVLQENPSGLIPAVLSMGETLKLPKYKDWVNYDQLPFFVRKMGFAIIHGG